MKLDEATRCWRQLFALTDQLRDQGADGYTQQLVNLTFNQLRMIKIVYVLNREFPEGVTLKVLAESLNITPAAASEMVDALVRKDVLCRDHNPQDRRAVAIRLAENCRKRFLEGEKNFDHVTADFLNTLSEERRNSFLSGLEALHNFLAARRN